MKKDIVIKNSHNDDMRTDIYIPSLPKENLPLIIFLHGFKGFKDWGGFPYLLEKISEKGFITVAFNFSYNGIEDDLMSFTRLDKFAENTFSRELDDLNDVINYFEKKSHEYNADFSKLTLLGHSRGGGIAILKAAEDSRVRRLITLAAVSEFNRYSEERKMEWKKRGYLEALNTRTRQKMRMNYTLLEDLEKNSGRLNILKSVSKIKIPFLILHGKEDLAVDYSEAEAIYNASDKTLTNLIMIEHTGHTFGIVHPFAGTNPYFEKIIDMIINFSK